ncbi:hypothetical protein E4U41_007294 [Claviceps citrina]|nr:hypothetical protein E4U41_007294 [Claviceps citrina]
MVMTRSMAAPRTDEPSQTAAEPLNRSRRGHKRTRFEVAKEASEASEASEDASGDSAPTNASFYRDINEQASARKKRRLDERERAADVEQLDDEPTTGQDQDQDHDQDKDQDQDQDHDHDQDQDQDQDQIVEPEHEEQQDPASECEESSSDEDELEMHVKDKPWDTKPMHMKYVEPEPADADPITVSISCSELNSLITDMKKKGWTNRKGEWSLKLFLQKYDDDDEDEDEHKWIPRIKTSDSDKCTSLLKRAAEFGRFLHAMSRDLEAQRQAIRERSKDVEAGLATMSDLVQHIKKEATGAESRAARAEKPRDNKLVTSIRKRLIPILVLILKEALLLGGSSRISHRGKHERIGPEEGTFMACTLQFALHIVGFIEQLYVVIANLVPEEDDDEATSEVSKVTQRRKRAEEAHRAMFGSFNSHLSALRNTLLGGRRALKEKAEAPRRRSEMKARDEAARQRRDSEELKILQTREKQYLDFVASTHEPVVQTEENRDLHRHRSYYLKHGWHYWEDLEMLEWIRKVKSPEAEILATRFPGRTEAEIVQRLRELRGWMKVKFEKQGQRPPKWCYY